MEQQQLKSMWHPYRLDPLHQDALEVGQWFFVGRLKGEGDGKLATRDLRRLDESSEVQFFPAANSRFYELYQLGVCLATNLSNDDLQRPGEVVLVDQGLALAQVAGEEGAFVAPANLTCVSGRRVPQRDAESGNPRIEKVRASGWAEVLVSSGARLPWTMKHVKLRPSAATVFVELCAEPQKLKATLIEVGEVLAAAKECFPKNAWAELCLGASGRTEDELVAKVSEIAEKDMSNVHLKAMLEADQGENRMFGKFCVEDRQKHLLRNDKGFGRVVVLLDQQESESGYLESRRSGAEVRCTVLNDSKSVVVEGSCRAIIGAPLMDEKFLVVASSGAQRREDQPIRLPFARNFVVFCVGKDHVAGVFERVAREKIESDQYRNVLAGVKVISCGAEAVNNALVVSAVFEKDDNLFEGSLTVDLKNRAAPLGVLNLPLIAPIDLLASGFIVSTLTHILRVSRVESISVEEDGDLLKFILYIII